ncbi:MAG: permease [Candidatus Muiribacteriota bacterium]
MFEFIDSKMHFMALNVISVFIEALPFLMGGSIIAAMIELWVKPSFFEKIIPKNYILALFTGLFAGIVLPVCECGIIPVVRKFLKKKVPLQTAIIYMIAGPIFNPLVIISTFMAFRGDVGMVFARLIIISVMAFIIAVVLGRNPENVLKKEFYNEIYNSDKTENDKIAICSEAGCSHNHSKSNLPWWINLIDNTANEFVYMAKFLALGAIAAGFFKTYIPSEIISLMSANIFTEIIVMMSFAFLLNVCSEADAFVANSFNMFSKTARVSFVTFGPPFDLKQLIMYNTIIKKKVILKMFVIGTIVNITGAWIYYVIAG